MEKRKIFVLLPDGIGLRNFVYGQFYEKGVGSGFDITYWNGTPYSFDGSERKHVPLNAASPHPLTVILKNARKEIELDRSVRRTGNAIYDGYRFPSKSNSLKSAVTNVLVSVCRRLFSGDRGLAFVRAAIRNLETRTPYYRECLETLKRERPDLVFCTNQRHSNSIAPIMAAKKLGIPTATFIFSWDNLPKATMVIEPDHYLVWSAHMQGELHSYYPEISPAAIHITGTPQFEPHLNSALLQSRELFFADNGLDPAKRYLCYSGDDVTTCPDDPLFLRDVAAVVRELNAQGEPLGIVFRRCPVDFSDRYDAVLAEFTDVIVPINPAWKKLDGAWDKIVPMPEDLELLVNTVAHCELVVNLGSSMVFDAVLHEKPCIYLRYAPEGARFPALYETLYRYIHFQSMPNPEAVIWLRDASEIAGKIRQALQDKEPTVKAAKEWFAKIVRVPAENASDRVFRTFSKILSGD